MDEQYDLELVLRFIALRYSDRSALRLYPDMETILTERALELARDPGFDRDGVMTSFRETFDVLWSVGPDVFRRYDDQRGRSVGAFSVSAYEAVTQGVSNNLQAWMEVPVPEREERLLIRISELWSDAEFRANSGGGVRPTQRIPFMSAVGSRVFVP